jgi:hypothetical protein
VAIQKRALAEGLPYQTLISNYCMSTRLGDAAVLVELLQPSDRGRGHAWLSILS